MDKKHRRRKCPFCKEYFFPDRRNTWHQEFCGKPQCRKASKANSQNKWLQKSENKDHFRGPENVKRVQEWRKANPGYSQRKKSHAKNALQDHLNGQLKEKQLVTTSLVSNALQDVLMAQPAVLIGLISHIAGTALQDDIAITASRLRQLGNDILNFKGGEENTKISDIPREGAESSQAIQLGGPSSGP